MALSRAGSAEFFEQGPETQHVFLNTGTQFSKLSISDNILNPAAHSQKILSH